MPNLRQECLFGQFLQSRFEEQVDGQKGIFNPLQTPPTQDLKGEGQRKQSLFFLQKDGQ